MVDWTDEGIVLAARPHGEGSAVVTLLTRAHGRHAGLVRGAFSGRARGVYQPGNRINAEWRARLSEHLGNYTGELSAGHAAAVLDDPLKLAGLSSACAVADASLPEREPHPRVHDGLAALLDAMVMDGIGDAWIAAYVSWEIGLLADLGYGLDLDACAATGSNDDLAYVSPRSGRAVSLAAGEPYRDKLLPLPRFLVGAGGGDPDDLFAGLALSGFFLERHVFATHGRHPPPSRTRFVERFAQGTTLSGGGRRE
ncbi:MAG: DNA repair protein RecO [Alphaproteobacteria bacterium]|nr:DNA repair protein RecO [Alphaproteobacteria bacterium]